jgi:hypothetical protein
MKIERNRRVFPFRICFEPVPYYPPGFEEVGVAISLGTGAYDVYTLKGAGP